MAFIDATTTGSVAINNDFDVSKKIPIDLRFPGRTTRFIGKISMITVFCENLSAVSKPTQLTIALFKDSTCDQALITDTTALISYGLTTFTKGSAIYKLDGIGSMNSGDDCYLVCKTNQGSCDVYESCITWEIV